MLLVAHVEPLLGMFPSSLEYNYAIIIYQIKFIQRILDGEKELTKGKIKMSFGI